MFEIGYEKREKIITQMQDEYKKWLEIAKQLNESGDIEITSAIDDKLGEIAKQYGYKWVAQGDVLILFENEEGNKIVAWHNDHDCSYGIDDTGFDDYEGLSEDFKQDVIEIREEVIKKLKKKGDLK